MQIHAQQVSNLPFPRAQQVTTLPLQAGAVPLQASTIPATATTTGTQLDINTLITPLISIMIVMMMMKMMTGAMGSISG